MTLHRDIGYLDVLPAALIDPLQELVSTYLSPNFRVTRAGASSVRVVAGADVDQVGACVQGKWRYNSATVTASLPSAAAGDYDVFICASDNVFTGGAPETDSTVYAFTLKALASGGTPSGAGGETWFRKVATVTWDGSKMVGIRQLPPRAPARTTSPFSGGPPSSPDHGDEWEATGVGPELVVWSFVYDATEAGAHKWRFTGGAPAIIADVVGAEAPSVDGSYGNLVTDGPLLVVARAGVYACRAFSGFTINGATAGKHADGKVGPALGNTDPAVFGYGSIIGDTTFGQSVDLSTEGYVTATAGGTLKLRYKFTSAGGAVVGDVSFGARVLTVTPVRVS